MSIVELSFEISDFFEAEVVQRSRDTSPDTEAPVWTQAMILEHLMFHTLEPTIRLAGEVNRALRVLNLLEDQCVRRTSAGQEEADLKVISAMLGWQKQLVWLYEKTPEKMFCHDKAHQLDTRSLVTMLGKRRFFAQSDDAGGCAGGGNKRARLSF